MALGLVLTGHFSNLFVFTSLILVHEFGHVIVAAVFRYKIDKIVIYPYGGLTKLDCFVNTDIYKDLLISISGVVLQCMYFFIVYLLYSAGIIRGYIYNLFYLYHNSMVLFNLLPIVPLDGFKILNLIFSKIFNLNLSNNLSVFVSLCTIIFFLFSDLYQKNYSMVLVIGLLMQNIYKFYYQLSHIYNRFLIERYLYDINYKKKIIINNEKKMYKNMSHLFMKNGKLISEKTFLSDFFTK